VRDYQIPHEHVRFPSVVTVATPRAPWSTRADLQDSVISSADVTKPQSSIDDDHEPLDGDASGQRATPEARGESRSSMADDPTAVWDGDSLAAAGFDVKTGKFTEPTAAARSIAPAKAAPRRGLSWPLTIALAIVVGLAVYFAVALLK
jgi:hypothetical protein